MQAVTYQEWASHAGAEEQVGTKAVVLDELLFQRPELKEKTVRMLMHSLAMYLMDNGKRPLMGQICSERDSSLMSQEWTAMLKVCQGDLPIEYLMFAYHAWQEEQAERMNWESKSLWQYLRHWLSRRLHRG